MTVADVIIDSIALAREKMIGVSGRSTMSDNEERCDDCRITYDGYNSRIWTHGSICNLPRLTAGTFADLKAELMAVYETRTGVHPKF